MPDNFLDSIVTDPPYGLKFMGKKWDADVPSIEIWKECLRVLKPGGYLLAFAGTRTQHRMAVRIEDAGFEIRDMIAWVYGSGFPKSHNVGKKLPEWEGWGTALKPAMEPITVARKPFKGTVAGNVLEWGTGGMNIDECRVETNEYITNHSRSEKSAKSKGIYSDSREQETHSTEGQRLGRFPANLIHDGSQQVLDFFPRKAGAAAPVRSGQNGKSRGIYGDFQNKGDDGMSFYSDKGSAARFFYCAKASKAERNAGCGSLSDKIKHTQMRSANGTGDKNFEGGFNDSIQKNNHPTVKPIALIKYLVQLVTRPGGLTYDPFGGSGTIKLAATELNMNYILSEIEKEYAEIAATRTSNMKQP